MSSYPPVRVMNSTKYAAEGSVSYAACGGDSWKSSDLPSGGSVSFDRGVCLLTEIAATVNGKAAKPYSSSGTSYSQFAIVEVAGEFQVTRVT